MRTLFESPQYLIQRVLTRFTGFFLDYYMLSHVCIRRILSSIQLDVNVNEP